MSVTLQFDEKIERCLGFFGVLPDCNQVFKKWSKQFAEINPENGVEIVSFQKKSWNVFSKKWIFFKEKYANYRRYSTLDNLLLVFD